MLNNKIYTDILFFLVTLLLTTATYSAIPTDCERNRPLYIGITGGYGQTTWGQLVPKDNDNAALNVSTPTHVSEGGGLWGVYGGYYFLPLFALEGSYMRYPVAHLTFDPTSLFTFYHNGRTELDTNTESVSIVAKILLVIPRTKIKFYSSIGGAGVHRYDAVVNRWRLSPTFGAGFLYDINKRFIAEFGTEYVAGYGQSEMDPAEHYVPFMYSGFLRLACRL